jgi:hypothetical protein
MKGQDSHRGAHPPNIINDPNQIIRGIKRESFGVAE